MSMWATLLLTVMLTAYVLTTVDAPTLATVPNTPTDLRELRTRTNAAHGAHMGVKAVSVHPRAVQGHITHSDSEPWQESHAAGVRHAAGACPVCGADVPRRAAPPWYVPGCTVDQTRAGQTRPVQATPDQTRAAQTRAAARMILTAARMILTVPVILLAAMIMDLAGQTRPDQASAAEASAAQASAAQASDPWDPR